MGEKIMFQSEKHITYKLCGDSLDTALLIHELEQEADEACTEIQAKITEYQTQLLQEFDANFTPRFNALIRQLSKELCIPFDEIKHYRLDATYLEDHNIAFLKHYPHN